MRLGDVAMRALLVFYRYYSIERHTGKFGRCSKKNLENHKNQLAVVGKIAAS